jgi:hypothetical protein
LLYIVKEVSLKNFFFFYGPEKPNKELTVVNHQMKSTDVVTFGIKKKYSVNIGDLIPPKGFYTNSLLKSKPKKQILICRRNGGGGGFLGIVQHASVGYLEMVSKTRYVQQHYVFLSGLENKLFSKTETLRYRNFFDP